MSRWKRPERPSVTDSATRNEPELEECPAPLARQRRSPKATCSSEASPVTLGVSCR